MRVAFAQMLRRVCAPLAPKDEVLERLLTACRETRFDKDEPILRAGDLAKDVYFVGGGLLRTTTVDAETGVERTGQFFDAGQIFSDAVAVLSGEQATMSVLAVEPSKVLSIPFAALRGAYDEDHAIERFGRLAVEEALKGVQRRATRLLNQSVEDRYRTFLETRPEVAKRLPQYLIASYLGVTPEALSRVRGRIARRRPDAR